MEKVDPPGSAPHHFHTQNVWSGRQKVTSFIDCGHPQLTDYHKYNPQKVTKSHIDIFLFDEKIDWKSPFPDLITAFTGCWSFWVALESRSGRQRVTKNVDTGRQKVTQILKAGRQKSRWLFGD